MVKKKDQEIERLQDEVNELKSQLQQFKAIDLGNETQTHNRLK
jgi:uncharacterized protein YlxW (UPF0749 family)